MLQFQLTNTDSLRSIYRGGICLTALKPATVQVRASQTVPGGDDVSHNYSSRAPGLLNVLIPEPSVSVSGAMNP